MEKYDLKGKDVKLHNILFATTSEPDYEMNRYILLEDMEGTKWDEYVVVDGYHCSCYNFDETQWEAIKYTKEELLKLAHSKVEKNLCYGCEEDLYNYVLKNLK